jgi:hypothetical protein
MPVSHISDGPLPSVLQEVDLPIIENSLCESMYEKAGYRYSSKDCDSDKKVQTGKGGF